MDDEIPATESPVSQEKAKELSKHEARESNEDGRDYSKLPSILDKQFEKFDKDSAVHATIINAQPSWQKSSQQGLLGKASSSCLSESALKTEKNAAFDLLDALTRSGILSIDEATLHLLIASTHQFDNSLLNTIIHDNINPIERAERSTIIIASTIHNQPPGEIINPDLLPKLAAFTPELFQ